MSESAVNRTMGLRDWGLVLGLSVITNVNLPDHYLPAPVEQIIATANEAAPRLHHLIDRVLPKIE